MIVLPETTLRAESGEQEATAARLAAPLGRDAVLVVGVDRVSSGGEDNAALALGAGGRLLASYSKRHLLPPFELRYRPGTQPATVRVGSLTAGLAICKDLDFPSLGRDNAREGAAIVLAPAWDFTADGWLHSRMAVLRRGRERLRARPRGAPGPADRQRHARPRARRGPERREPHDDAARDRAGRPGSHRLFAAG